MKKALIFIVLLLSISLSACQTKPSYDAIYEDFQTHLEENQSIYLERIAFINRITDELIKGVVKVKKLSSNLSSITLGSGIVFYDTPMYYYIITNNHVVYDDNIIDSDYIVYDYQNNSYPATYIVGDNDYDLAVLRVKKRFTILTVLKFATENLEVNNHITTVGYPESQSNAINMGQLIDYGPIGIDLPSSIINVTFDVMVANLPVKVGSSGSGAINDQFGLVGIVYAGNFTGGSNISDYAFLIPINQVKSFLSANNLSYREVT